MDTRSELTVDIEESIASAYNPSLTYKERKQVQTHLTYILPKLKEPNSLIDPVKGALTQITQHRPWHEKPIGILLIAIVGAVISAGIVFILGWNK